MKKILSVFLGLALCCILAALPVCAEEAAAPAAGEGNGHVTLVAEPQALIPVYVDEEAEGAEGTVEQAMADFSVGGTIMGLVKDSGLYDMVKGNWKSGVMILIAFLLLYLAIVKQFEPLLLRRPLPRRRLPRRPPRRKLSRARRLPRRCRATSSM